MKKLLVVIMIALVVAATVWVVVRVQLAKRMAAVPVLLPQTTLLLLQAPDFQKTRADWHESDLYKIWHEPSVEAFLQKPLERLPKNSGGRQTLAEFLELGPKHGFLALTSLENNEPKLIGGFHFDATPEKVREFIAQRKAELLSKTATAKPETIVYAQHQIETLQVSHFVFASVCDNQWYFASNDLAELKALLDRLDHRREKAQASLAENAAFTAAANHLPGEYAGMIFLDPRPFVEKLMPLVKMTGQSLPMDQLERLRQVQSVAAAVAFDHGKMREIDFVAMPQVSGGKGLKLPLLEAAGTNTFFYSASRVHWPANLLTPSGPAAVGMPALVQQFTDTMKSRGISPEDLRQAFGDELEIVGDWPAEAHWPTLIATLPVNDFAHAKKIMDALTSIEIGGAPWTQSEHDGATFYSAQPFGGFVPVHPTVALSGKFMLVGSEEAAAAGALQRITQPTGELKKSAIFHSAAAQVPPADSAFNYVDTGLFYQRLDAAARPLLLMGATFYPALGQTVDLSKLPPPEAITKHLSPIVMTQRYETDGYVTESVGPIAFREATIGLAGAAAGLFIYLREGLKSGVLSQTDPTAPANSAVVFPDASPTPSPF